MTSAAIQDKITAYGYTTNTGDITGVDLTGGTGIAIASESGTTSGNYSSTINCNLEGTELISTGEGGGTKFLREDGDGSCSWQTPTDTNTQLSQEQVEDFAGALVASGGTKTGITVTYQDSSGDMDFAVSDTTVAGDSGSTGMTPGDTLTIAGGTNATTAMSGDTLTVNVDDAFLKNNADDTTTGIITIDKTSSATDAVTNVFTIQSQSSGTPANGIGVGMAFGIETAAGNVETGARIEAVVTDVSDSDEDIDLVFYTMLSGDAANEALRVHDDGNLTVAGDLTITGGNIKNAVIAE